MGISFLVGTMLAFLSGLGAGGGSLLILYLTLVQNMASHEARAINLLFFLPSALISCLFRYRQGHLPIKKVLPAIFAGSIMALLFTFLSRSWDLAILQKLFGVLLLYTGVREILYKPK